MGIYVREFNVQNMLRYRRANIMFFDICKFSVLSTLPVHLLL